MTVKTIRPNTIEKIDATLSIDNLKCKLRFIEAKSKSNIWPNNS